jgi:hypothetical protein
MDALGGLLQSVGAGITGLVGGAFRAFGDAIQGAVHALQSVLPGFWLPAAAIALVLVVGWTLIKR